MEVAYIIGCDEGTWTTGGHAYTITYQWQNVVIDELLNTVVTNRAGETAASYQLRQEDFGCSVQCKVSCTLNETGGTVANRTTVTTAMTLPVGVDVASPRILEQPTMEPAVDYPILIGDTLNCDHGVWAGDDLTYGYQWMYSTTKNAYMDDNATWQAIPEYPADETLVVPLNSVGWAIKCRVTASNGSGNAYYDTTPQLRDVVCPSAGVAALAVYPLDDDQQFHYSGGNPDFMIATPVADISGNHYDGISYGQLGRTVGGDYYGGPIFEQDPLGDFNGNLHSALWTKTSPPPKMDDVISMPVATGLTRRILPTKGPWSVGMLVLPTGTADAWMCAAGNTHADDSVFSGQGPQLQINPGQRRIRVSEKHPSYFDTTYVYVTSDQFDIDPDKGVFVFWTRDASYHVKLYADGVLVGSGTGASQDSGTDAHDWLWYFGGHSSYYYGFSPVFRGNIDEVLFYDEVLTADEVATVTTSGPSQEGYYPRNIEIPKVLGDPIVGETLTVSDGEWAYEPSYIIPTGYAYQWSSSEDNVTFTPIAGETTYTYTIVEGDIGNYINCTVAATNTYGTLAVGSTSVGPVTDDNVDAPHNTVLPLVTGDTAVGDTLSTTNGTWSHVPTSYTYQWQHSSGGGYINISGATSSTHTLAAARKGQRIRCIVAAHNAAGYNHATSNNVGPVTAAGGHNKPSGGIPVITPTACPVGTVLTCAHGTWAGDATITYAYQWKHMHRGETKNIAGETSSTYTVTSGQKGYMLACAVKATNGYGHASATADAVGPVPGTPVVGDPDPYSLESYGDQPGGWTLVLADRDFGLIEILTPAVTKISVTWNLNRPSSLNFEIPADCLQVYGVASDGHPKIDPLRRTVGLYQEEKNADGDIEAKLRWVGYIWTVQEIVDGEVPRLQVQCYDPWMRLSKRFVLNEDGIATKQTTFTLWDEAQIAKTLITRANAYEGSPESAATKKTGITTTDGTFQSMNQPTGFTHIWDPATKILDALQELTDTYGGPDVVMIPVEYGNGNLVRMSAYRKYGKDRTKQAVFSWGCPPHNLKTVSRLVDGGLVANFIRGYGEAGSGTKQPTSLWTDSDSLDDYGYYQDVENIPIGVKSGVTNFIKAEGKLRNKPRQNVSIGTVAGASLPKPFVDFRLGDTIRVNAGPAMRGGWTALMRVYGFTIEIDESGVAQLTNIAACESEEGS